MSSNSVPMTWRDVTGVRGKWRDSCQSEAIISRTVEVAWVNIKRRHRSRRGREEGGRHHATHTPDPPRATHSPNLSCQWRHKLLTSSWCLTTDGNSCSARNIAFHIITASRLFLCQCFDSSEYWPWYLLTPKKKTRKSCYACFNSS